MGFWKSLFSGSEESPEEIALHKKEAEFDVLRTDGQKASRVGQHDYAVRCFRKALEIKDDLEVRDYLAHALIRNHELQDAITELDILQDAEPDNIQIALLKAQVCYMLEDYDGMKACLESRGEDALVCYWLAKAYIGLEDNEKAIELLCKAVRAKEDFWDAYLLRCQTYLKMDKMNEAQKDSDHLLNMVGEQEETLLMKARIEAKKGETEQAMQDYNKVIEVNPFSVEGFRERALLKKQQGDEDGYKEDMETSISINANGTDEDIEEKIKQQYRNIDPYGIFG